MSYDLMVFDADSAPRGRAEFLAWYEEQTRWRESHGYHDAAVTTPELRAWFQEMAEVFPPLNGPSAGSVDDPKTTDYAIGHSMIYAAFAWSQAQAAYLRVVELAAKQGVGFFDVSSTAGRIWFPDDGELKDGSSDAAHAPQLGDPDYDLKSFGRDVGGGGLRWLATVLALLGGILTVCIFAAWMSRPNNMNPTVGKGVIIGATVFWSAVAVMNWLSWRKMVLKGEISR